jgi:CheY-like chemotaxis protein
MPVMDGFRLYRLIKQIDNKAKVLFATACLSYDILRRYFPIKDGNIVIDGILGDNSGRFMKKPVHIDELVQRVKSELLS